MKNILDKLSVTAKNRVDKVFFLGKVKILTLFLSTFYNVYNFLNTFFKEGENRWTS